MDSPMLICPRATMVGISNPERLMKPTDLSYEDFQAMLLLFQEESDRGAAVLAGSYLESSLGTFLESKLVDKTLAKKLLGSSGALCTFEQRIDVAQGFGFLNPNLCSMLSFIRKIRNHFAHHPKEASFAADPVRNWVRGLISFRPLTETKGSPYTPDDGKGIYLFTVALVYGAMIASTQGQSPAVEEFFKFALNRGVAREGV